MLTPHKIFIQRVDPTQMERNFTGPRVQLSTVHKMNCGDQSFSREMQSESSESEKACLTTIIATC